MLEAAERTASERGNAFVDHDLLDLVSVLIPRGYFWIIVVLHISGSGNGKRLGIGVKHPFEVVPASAGDIACKYRNGAENN